MNKAALQSEVYSSELNCLSTVREGTKLVVGSGEGALYIFNEVNSKGLDMDPDPTLRTQTGSNFFSPVVKGI